jgi:hypothetical protein
MGRMRRIRRCSMGRMRRIRRCSIASTSLAGVVALGCGACVLAILAAPTHLLALASVGVQAVRDRNGALFPEL